jgi:dTDP-glucose pyrophosphorylase
MADWTKTLVREHDSIRHVMQCIDDAELQIALVVDGAGRLKGVITDGDLRRGLLSGLTLDAPAQEFMTRDPVTATPDMRMAAIEEMMYERDLHQIPVRDESGVIVSLALHGRFLPRDRLENQVILMVGGLGSRLGDLTRHTPKPLLRIGGKPILEIILDGLISQGLHRFSLAVNYKGEMIERYFGDGRRWGASISYLRESKRLGTCGALSLIDNRPTEPLIVMNGDILAKIDYVRMLEFHQTHKATATVAVRSYDVDVPFGVVDSEAGRVTALVEKPRSRFQVNAGVYVLDPSCIALVPDNEYFDMTSLLGLLIDSGKAVYQYAINDYWLDIGRSADFYKANDEYHARFGDREVSE